jgi:glutathione synthase/RimK-type ligase-like ATP-grasp enzyme
VRVLIAVDAATRELTADDCVFADELRRAGLHPVPVVWGGAVGRRSVIVLRSTWDYVERYGRFLSWLDRLDVGDVQVWNSTALCRWGAHKGYLRELADRGVPVVPTELLGRGTTRTLGDVMTALGWSDAVVKPAVGGTARLSIHVAETGEPAAADHLAALTDREDAVAQPFLASVVTHGEVSVVVIDGAPVSAVEKRARPGEWRVQSDFGGSVRPVELDSELRAVASAAIAAVPEVPLYARVDVVRMPGGDPAVLEVEVVEPELFFSLDRTIATRLVDALRRRLDEVR